jgi:hypothetical protein
LNLFRPTPWRILPELATFEQFPAMHYRLNGGFGSFAATK